jgi:hypothetical protein
LNVPVDVVFIPFAALPVRNPDPGPKQLYLLIRCKEGNKEFLPGLRQKPN